MRKLYDGILALSLLTGTYVLPNGNLLGTDYKQLKYWFMRSSGIKQEDLAVGKESILIPENQEPDFSLPTFDPLTRQLMIYDILQTLPTDLLAPVFTSSEQQKSVEIMHRDLEVFCGDGGCPQVNLAAVTECTRSAAGSVVYRKMLANPLASSDFKKFRTRQALIQALIENPDLFEKADALCSEMAENEERLLSNWQDPDAVSSEVFERFFYKKSYLQFLNTNPTYMEILTRLNNFGTAMLLGGLELSIWLAAASEYRAVKNANRSTYNYDEQRWITKEPINYGQALYRTMRTFLTFINPLTYPSRARARIKELEEARAWNAQTERMNLYVKIPLAATVFSAFKAYGIKMVLEAACQVKDANNFLQDRLIGLGNLVRSVNALEALGAEYTEVANGLVSWQHIDNLLYRAGDDNFTALLHLLQTDTFTGESSFFSRTGRVLAAHKLATKERDLFAGAIELMGELDACVSVAKLYKQFQRRRVKYCMVNINQERRPHIKLQGFWNPFVDYNVVVANDIELGGTCPEQHVVLTGSNTGGKSTVGLKGTLLNVYFAHTFGIAPASMCELSVFSDFSSYIHVVDDVATGESAFQAEINRANSLIRAVKSLDQHQFAFIVIDELFKGTSPEKGAPGACKVVKHLAGYPNVITIIATHFKEMTHLEQELPSIINMKMEIFEDDAGNLIKPYKLEKGISTHNIADKLMESGLDIYSLDIV